MIEPLPAGARLEPPETNAQSQFFSRRYGELDQSRPSDFRHSGWQPNRQRIWDSFDRLAIGASRSHAFSECGRFAYVLQSTEDPSKYRVAGSTCHDRFCLPCGQERSRTIGLNVLDRLGKHDARFLTLTLKSTTESLSFLLDKLTTSFSALRRSKLWRQRVSGGVAFTEIKWKPGKRRWNVHLHSIIQGRYIPKRNLAAAWRRVTDGSYIIDIKLIKNRASIAQYVTKYASKPLDATVLRDPARLDESITALKGKRLATTFGGWRGVLLTPKPDEEAWTNLGSLRQAIESAEHGDAWALTAMAGLGVTVVTCTKQTRGPPKPVAFSCEPFTQGTLQRETAVTPSTDLAFD
jgi:hypothetical protein